VSAFKPDSTYLESTDRLPLSCSRAGTCCHGKTVWLNPWELACLAKVKGLSSREFRDRYCEFGGIRLRFNGASGWKGLPTCSQYQPGRGCDVHEGRPLVCRLYPLGRQRRGEEVAYLHRGAKFPCLEGCPEVVALPHLSVADYLEIQRVAAGEAAQDEYLELMQHLADGAFALLFESGLSAGGDRLTLPLWRRLGDDTPEQLAEFLEAEWIDRLMLPDIGDFIGDPVSFTQRHYDSLQAQAQESFGNLGDADALRAASGVMMGLALHLGRGLGANPADLSKKWIGEARRLGAGDHQ
jgi:uncharacterized protein